MSGYLNSDKSKFEQLSKNTVAADNQLKDGEWVRFYNANGKGKRIMLVGNSITLHAVSEEIGWFNEWGMAASSEEKDYVHLLMSMTNDVEKDAAFCVCQVSSWEKSYHKGEDAFPLFKEAFNFTPDIIIARFIENCSGEDFDNEIYKAALKNLLTALSNGNTPKVILTTGFWHHPGDGAIREAAQEWGFPLIELGDLGERDEMKAIGLFDHSGVANHPGDLGMKTIADRIFDVLKSFFD